MRKSLLIWFCLTMLLRSSGQNPVFRSFTNSNGLPSNTIYYILQDSRGFIWLGHDKGLSRYDGNTFVHYSAPGQQGKSVSNLMEMNGNIWCQDFAGNFYYTQKEQLVHEPRFKSSASYAVAGYAKNHLRVISYDSLRSFNTVTKEQRVIPASVSPRQGVLHEVSASFFTSAHGLHSFDGSSVKTVYTFEQALPVFNYLISSNNRYYGFSRIGFPMAWQLDNNQVKPLPVLREGLVIQDITLLEDEIWISTSTGAYCFDKNMQPLYKGHCFFEDKSITRMLKDREGNYWFGTLNKGLIMVPDINVLLYKYSTESITALSAFANNREILAGTSSNLVFSFSQPEGQINTLVSNEAKGEIFSLFYDPSNETIITCGSNVSFYKNGRLHHTEPLAGKSVAIINENLYALAYAGGIALLPRKAGSIEIPQWLMPFASRVQDKFFLTQGARGRVVLFDSLTQTLYTATSQGLKYYSANGSGTCLYNGKPVYASSLCAVNGTIYAGSFSDGIFRIRKNETGLLNEQIPLLAKSVYKIYADQNKLWIISDDFMQRLELSNNSVTNFTAADGLPRAEIKDILVLQNRVYLGTTDGLVSFDATKNSVNQTAPLLLLNRLTVNEKETAPSGHLRFKTDENNIELFFSVLAFKDNNGCTVSYRLNDAEWKQLAPGQRNLQLASLASGQYTIEIKAENEDGIAAGKNIVLSFSIATPFYKRWWFLVLTAILIMAAMYFYFKQKLYRQKKNNELLQQKIKLEQELHQSMLSSIKSQMNPHFLFNALNTIQAYIFINEKENASLYLGKFSELTRSVLDMSNKERISLAEEIRALQLYIELEQLRFEDKLQYSLTVDPQISTETTYIPSMLIQPFVENAIKHGLMHQKNKWELKLKFEKTTTGIQVMIDDNGVGRKASEAINRQRQKNHQSFASQANQKRLEILNKGLQQAISLEIIDKTDAYGQASGTTVILSIPVL